MSGRSERAEVVRRLVREARHGLLATAGLEPAGFPYGSLVQLGSTAAGEPTFLVSHLAQHTKNLVADPRCSVAVLEPTAGDPMQAPRATLLGRARKLEGTEAEAATERFLRLHPDAEMLFQINFDLWALRPEEARFIGGFGAAAWVSGTELIDG